MVRIGSEWLQGFAQGRPPIGLVHSAFIIGLVHSAFILAYAYVAEIGRRASVEILFGWMSEEAESGWMSEAANLASRKPWRRSSHRVFAFQHRSCRCCRGFVWEHFAPQSSIMELQQQV